jgi:hypothetical protein
VEGSAANHLHGLRSVSAGDHTVSVEYYEHTEVAVARLAISP